MVGTGESNGTFNAMSGLINGFPVQITNPVTSGINSVYSFEFVLSSSIPRKGIILIEMPEELTLRVSEVYSDGVCALMSTLTCTSVKDGVITIQTQEVIYGGSTHVWNVHGINNPRSQMKTGVIKIRTFASNGLSEIDSGFNQDVQMTELAQMESFTVTTGSSVNGEENTYTFSINSRVTILDGDTISFNVPAQVGLPQTVEELDIIPLPREVDGERVTDRLTIEMIGQMLYITFVEVAPISEVYQW